MKRVIGEPGWGNVIIEDTDTKELSFQCLSGGFAMYWHRIVLTPKEVVEYKSGLLDVNKIANEMNHHTERMASRIVASYSIEDIQRKDDAGAIDK